jgi:hypothetical protein
LNNSPGTDCAIAEVATKRKRSMLQLRFKYDLSLSKRPIPRLDSQST